MAQFLDTTGLQTLWNKIKSSFLSLSGGTVNGTIKVASGSNSITLSSSGITKSTKSDIDHLWNTLGTTTGVSTVNGKSLLYQNSSTVSDKDLDMRLHVWAGDHDITDETTSTGWGGESCISVGDDKDNKIRIIGDDTIDVITYSSATGPYLGIQPGIQLIEKVYNNMNSLYPGGTIFNHINNSIPKPSNVTLKNCSCLIYSNFGSILVACTFYVDETDGARLNLVYEDGGKNVVVYSADCGSNPGYAMIPISINNADDPNFGYGYKLVLNYS